MNNNPYPHNSFPPPPGAAGFTFPSSTSAAPQSPYGGAPQHQVSGQFPPAENGTPTSPYSVSGGEPAKQPFPIISERSTDRRVSMSEIRFLPQATHRASIENDRVLYLMEQIQKFAHIPPVILWQAPNKDLVLLDGWHRLEAFRRLGVDKVSAIIVADSLATALAYAVRKNKPHNGRMREDNDALRALCVMATALGRTLDQAEANSLGVAFREHEVLSQFVIEAWPLPTLSPARLADDKSSGPRKKSPLKTRPSRAGSAHRANGR